MMDQERWSKLQEAFDTEELFWKDGDSCDANELDFNIMEWLECSGTSPSCEMMNLFRDHGYSVLCKERDSFGWLIGAVLDRKTGKEIIFG